MKFLFFSIVFVLGSFISIGQRSTDIFVNEPNTETTRHSDDEKVIYDAHWAGFDIGFNTMMSAPFKRDFDSNPYWENNIANSIQFNMGLWEYKIPIVRQYLGITTGLGFSISSYSFKNDAKNYTLQYNSDTTYAQVFSPGILYNDTIDGKLRNNYLTLGYFTVPLLIEFATKEREKKSFYAAAGVVAGIRFTSSYLQSGRYESGDRFYNTIRAKYNTNLLSIEATARFGYDWGGFFASYNLNTLFKEGKTVNVYPFRAGITFNVDYNEISEEEFDFDFENPVNDRYSK
jgi:hypothetical protein